MGVYITFFFQMQGVVICVHFVSMKLKYPIWYFCCRLDMGGKGSFTLLPFYIFLKIKVLTYKISPDALTQGGSLTRHY